MNVEEAIEFLKKAQLADNFADPAKLEQIIELIELLERLRKEVKNGRVDASTEPRPEIQSYDAGR